MDKKAENPVGAVRNSIRLLQDLREMDGATISELAERNPLSKGAIHNHLATLREWGYVENDGAEYAVGLRWLEFGGFARDKHDVYKQARPVVDELAAETGELALVTVETQGRSMYLYQESGPKAVTTDSHVGIRLPLHCTGTGKAMLAEFSDSKFDAIVDYHGLERFTENTITNVETLRNEIQTVRERGFALDDEERIDGMRGVGVSIAPSDSDGVVGAISVTGPTHRLKDELFYEEIPDLLVGSTKEIEINLKFER